MHKLLLLWISFNSLPTIDSHHASDSAYIFAMEALRYTGLLIPMGFLPCFWHGLQPY